MLNKKIAELINEQINKEFYSAYLYLDFANFLADEGLDGFANWYEIQAQEERDHAMLLRKYLIDNGIKVTLELIEKPNKDFKEVMDVLLNKKKSLKETLIEYILNSLEYIKTVDNLSLN